MCLRSKNVLQELQNCLVARTVFLLQMYAVTRHKTLKFLQTFFKNYFILRVITVLSGFIWFTMLPLLKVSTAPVYNT